MHSVLLNNSEKWFKYNSYFEHTKEMMTFSEESELVKDLS